MSLPIKFREQADRDMAAIVSRISVDDPDVGERFIKAVREQTQSLAMFPGIGTLRPKAPRHLKGIRLIPLSGFRKYLLFYLVTESGLEVVRVLHGARNLNRVLRRTD